MSVFPVHIHVAVRAHRNNQRSHLKVMTSRPGPTAGDRIRSNQRTCILIEPKLVFHFHDAWAPHVSPGPALRGAVDKYVPTLLRRIFVS